MKVEFIPIARNPALFYGWPANHGHWQWGDEMLFGAAVGARDNTVTSMHKVSGLLQKVLFRSMDGGLLGVPLYPMSILRVRIPNRLH